MNLSTYYYFDWVEKISDKGTDHSYIQNYYCNKFTPLKYNPIVMLEIGVYKGQSLRLWKEWFTNGIFYCIDIDDNFIKKLQKNDPTIKSFTADAYTKEVVNKFEDNFFDIIIDDGPHTLESQLFSIKNWIKKLKVGGLLIIEDIQNFEYVDQLVASIPQNESMQFSSFYYDLRTVKNRYDDILLEITRIK